MFFPEIFNIHQNTRNQIFIGVPITQHVPGYEYFPDMYFTDSEEDLIEDFDHWRPLSPNLSEEKEEEEEVVITGSRKRFNFESVDKWIEELATKRTKSVIVIDE